MAVTHAFGCAHNGELDRTAEALACVCIRIHGYFPYLLVALIREINWPHRVAIDLQLEDVWAGVMAARIELPT